MDLDVAKITEIFLLPNSVLVGALAIANTESLKSTVSLIGFGSSLLWLFCNLDALGEGAPFRVSALARLPLLFLALWLVSGVYHGTEYLWERRNRSRSGA